MEVTFEFKKLILNKGFYGMVKLEVENKKDRNLDVQINDSSKWDLAVRFGIEYFYEQYLKKELKGLSVRVMEIEGQEVDTSSMVIFYVTVKAMEKALGFNLDTFRLSEDANFIIQK